MGAVSSVLVERAKTHGSYTSNASVAQYLRLYWRQSPHWDTMPVEHREALDQFATKLSRILSGQSSFKDHWDDIAGYATLAANAPISYDDRQLANQKGQ